MAVFISFFSSFFFKWDILLTLFCFSHPRRRLIDGMSSKKSEQLKLSAKTVVLWYTFALCIFHDMVKQSKPKTNKTYTPKHTVFRIYTEVYTLRFSIFVNTDSSLIFIIHFT